MRDFNKELNYRPYQGTGGPSEKVVEACNMKLFTALVLSGLRPKLDRNEDEPDTVFVVVDSRRVTFDRWGYCNEDGHPDIELDQVDLNTAVAYFVEGK
jgi:hypothetical protein